MTKRLFPALSPPMLFFVTALLLSPSMGCVSSIRYKKEREAKNTLEIQNAMLFKENAERKREQQELIDRLETLSKKNGKIELELLTLTNELTKTTQMLGESSTKLLEENKNLSQQLVLIKNENEKKTALINSIKSVQSNAADVLYNCQQELADMMFAWLNRGVTIELLQDHVRITFPDQLVFDQNGVNIGINGYAVLSILGKYLNEKPAIKIHVVSHTDNSLPRDKSINDTYEWSMIKSTNIVKALIRDYNVNTNQITPIAQGEFRPIASNTDAEGRSRNRRTEILLYPPDITYPDIRAFRQ